MEEHDRGDQLDEAHRQSGWMLVFTMALLVVLLYSKLSMIPDGQILFFILIFVPLPIAIIITRAYFRKDVWALPWVTMIWIVAIASCFIMMVIEISLAIEGDTWAMVQGALLLFLCWSMMQRLRMLRHPIFQAWYEGAATSMMQNISLQSGEVLASCPNCQSLLAIRPSMLSEADKCPNCDSKLVSASTLSNHHEEE